MSGSNRPVGAMLLTPGAGSSASHPSLVAIETALEPLPVTRLDFAYRREGRRAPDRAPKLIACIREEVARFSAATGVESAHMVLGGRSMGGRMCSLAVAEGLPAAGLVLISYPLHPPGKPDQLRTAHFGALDLPCLFISGERDAFGTRAEFDTHVGAIPGEVTQVWLAKAGHDLKGQDAAIVAAVLDWLRGLGRQPP